MMKKKSRRGEIASVEEVEHLRRWKAATTKGLHREALDALEAGLRIAKGRNSELVPDFEELKEEALRRDEKTPPRVIRTPKTIRCSFCGVNRKVDRRMVWGWREVICGACISDAAELLEAEGGRIRKHLRVVGAGRKKGVEAKRSLQCSFCAKDKESVSVLVLVKGKRGIICDECVRTGLELKSNA